MALTPDDVRTVVFKSSTLLRHGYDMGEVDDFLDEIALTLEELLHAQQPAPGPEGANSGRIAIGSRPGPGPGQHSPNGNPGQPGKGGPGQPVSNGYPGGPGPNVGQRPGPPAPDQQRLVGELRARVRDLESELAVRKSAPPAPAPRPAPGNDLLQRLDELERENALLRKESEKDLVGISTRAVNLLTQAQRTADRTIADADKYARDLVMNARSQFQEILQRAQALSRVTGADSDKFGGAASTAELEYIRNCAQLAHAQLQSLLATLPAEQMSPAPRPEGLPRQ